MRKSLPNLVSALLTTPHPGLVGELLHLSTGTKRANHRIGVAPGFPNSAISEERSVIASILRVGYLAHMPTPFRFQELGSSYHTSTRDLNRSGVNSAARLPRSPKKSKLGVGPVVNSDCLGNSFCKTILLARGLASNIGSSFRGPARHY